MNDIILTILICHVTGREKQLERLMDVLRPQLPTDQSVELIIKEELPHKQGGPTIGANRNAALADAIGEYVCFVDDDDMVGKDYVAKIFKALESKPDVVGIRGHYCVGDKKPELFEHFLKHEKWETKDGVYLRPPNHLNPVKLELARKVGFHEINHSEDKEYSMELRPLLKTEAIIEDVIYFYLK